MITMFNHLLNFNNCSNIFSDGGIFVRSSHTSRLREGVLPSLELLWLMLMDSVQIVQVILSLLTKETYWVME